MLQVTGILTIHTELVAFNCNNGHAKAPQRYVIRALSCSCVCVFVIHLTKLLLPQNSVYNRMIKKTGNICKVRGRNPIKVQQQYLSIGPDENHDVTKSRYTMYAIKIRTGHIANAIPER